METKKEITIDELAGMMQRGFVALENKMDSKFDKLDSKFDRLDNKVNGLKSEMDRKFDRVDERFDQVLTNQDHILGRLENLETDNTAGAEASRRQEDKLEDYEKRIIVTEKKLGIGAAI
ncbi:MAG: hypothetical protein KAQ87_01960 [Candidatus Pacebacteria bacterium]|nr:hypothetical protein [Candidatus Paceibacterota bacterium]